MEITQDRIDAAYAVADKNQKKVLDAIFGKQNQKNNRPITERIKTFNDALKELVAKDYPGFPGYPDNEDDFFEMTNDLPDDVVAYMQLRVIVIVLNEGWTPKFIEDEWRYAPWFKLYTNKELDEMNKEDRDKVTSCRVVDWSFLNAYAYNGIVYAGAYVASSYSSTYSGSRLAFKTYELAEYAGKQFIDIYARMMGLEIIEK